MRKLVNVQTFTPKITPLSSMHTRLLFNFSIKLLNRLDLKSRYLSNIVGMAFCEAGILHVISRSNNEHTFLKAFPSRACCGKLASTALCSCFAANRANEVCFWGQRMHTPSTGRSVCIIIMFGIYVYQR